MQPSVVGSFTVHDSGEKPPSALRGAGAASGDFAVTNPPVRLSPPTSASAFSAASFCFAIAARFCCCAFTSASRAAFAVSTLLIAAFSSRSFSSLSALISSSEIAPLQERVGARAAQQEARGGHAAGAVLLCRHRAHLGQQHVPFRLRVLDLEAEA